MIDKIIRGLGHAWNLFYIVSSSFGMFIVIASVFYGIRLVSKEMGMIYTLTVVVWPVVAVAFRFRQNWLHWHAD